MLVVVASLFPLIVTGLQSSLPRLVQQRPLERRGQARRAVDAWESYLGLLEAHPLPVKMATATVIIGAGDAAAQAIEQVKGSSDFSLARVSRWAFFGLVLQAP